jgi:hypothetical protein
LRGRDIDEFLGYISTVDDGLIEDILTYTRYSDGVSDIQWLASKYLFDESALQNNLLLLCSNHYVG